MKVTIQVKDLLEALRRGGVASSKVIKHKRSIRMPRTSLALLTVERDMLTVQSESGYAVTHSMPMPKDAIVAIRGRICVVASDLIHQLSVYQRGATLPQYITLQEAPLDGSESTLNGLDEPSPDECEPCCCVNYTVTDNVGKDISSGGIFGYPTSAVRSTSANNGKLLVSISASAFSGDKPIDRIAITNNTCCLIYNTDGYMYLRELLPHEARVHASLPEKSDILINTEVFATIRHGDNGWVDIIDAGNAILVRHGNTTYTVTKDAISKQDLIEASKVLQTNKVYHAVITPRLGRYIRHICDSVTEPKPSPKKKACKPKQLYVKASNGRFTVGVQGWDRLVSFPSVNTAYPKTQLQHPQVLSKIITSMRNKEVALYQCKKVWAINPLDNPTEWHFTF